MRQWLDANGGWLAVILVGVALTGVTSRPLGIALIAFGTLFLFGSRLWDRLPRTRERRMEALAANVIGDLSPRECQIIQQRLGAEDAYAANPGAVAGPPMVSLGEGGYGPMTMSEAREAFDALQRHGVFDPDGQNGTTLYYRWTELGRRVATKLREVNPL